MWDWWKRLFKRLDTNEAAMEDQIKSKVKDERKNHLHTRVTYQYPSKSPFRFPVIPDEQEREKVQERRQTRSHTVRKQEKRETYKETKRTREHSQVKRNTKVSEKKKPFVPTPVASPIYGYRKRNQEVETVPAFIRKTEEREKDSQIRISKDREPEDIQLSYQPLKKVNEAPELHLNENVSTEPTSMVESNVIHLVDYESQKISPVVERKDASVLIKDEEKWGSTVEEEDFSADLDEQEAEIRQAEEEVSSAIVNAEESPVHVNEQEAEIEQVDLINESSISMEEPIIEGAFPKADNEKVEKSELANLIDETKQLEPEQKEISHTSEEMGHDQGKGTNPMSANTEANTERPIPYNVMMTSQDQFFLKLQREQKAKEEKQRRRMEVKKDTYIPNHLLDDPIPENNEDELWLKDQQELLEDTLKHFNVRASVVRVTQGPAVTRFEVQPELGVKVSKVRNLSDDIKLNMSAKDIRIEAPIPGKNTIGIEVPNLNAHMVGLQEIFETEDFKKNDSPLTIGLGLSVEGLPVVSDIAKMPHGLIAGATGSGKSVCINTILLSILYKANYNDVKLLLIDPKMVELSPYNGLPHLVTPVITDVKAATAALKWAVEEMEERYEKFVLEGVRDISRYNKKIKEQLRHEDKMSYIVIVIDELADLMMASPQDVEDSICRIAQKARACGIHLLLATQRPSVDVITGLIKANVPTRIAFSVSSQVDSRTIIDMNGAERLLGKGDMLFIENGASKSIRLQGAFVSDEEIERITNYVRKMAPPQYLFEQEQLIQMEMSEAEDELLEDAIQFVIRQDQASTSLLQRQFRIGYNRAARLIDTLESRGIISGQNGSKPRDILLSKTQVEEMYQ